MVFTKGNSKAINQNNTITASNFKFDKLKNIITADTKVKFVDNENKTTIFSDEATYLKNDEVVFTKGNSKAINQNNTITASNFKFDKLKNIITADTKVKFVDNENKTTIFSDEATYLKNDEVVFTKGNSKAINQNNTITASNFKFDKLKNIITADTKVKFVDNENKTTIFSDEATYLKNDEVVFTKGNSKAINQNNTITASNFKFDKLKNIITADTKVKFVDNIKDAKILSEKIIYLKNDEVVFTEGNTSAIIESKYEFKSKNVSYNILRQEIVSKEKSNLIDNNGNSYQFDNFYYEIDNRV